MKENIMLRKKKKKWKYIVCSISEYSWYGSVWEFVWLCYGEYVAPKLVPFLLIGLGVFIHLVWTFLYIEKIVSLANKAAH